KTWKLSGVAVRRRWVQHEIAVRRARPRDRGGASIHGRAGLMQAGLHAAPPHRRAVRAGVWVGSSLVSPAASDRSFEYVRSSDVPPRPNQSDPWRPPPPGQEPDAIGRLPSPETPSPRRL